MPTTTDYINALNTQKANLAANLTTMGVPASSDETFNTLVPKVLEVSAGSGDSGSSKLKELVSGSITEITANDLAGITDIKPYKFYQSFYLNSVELPDGITRIWDYGFASCQKLSNIKLGAGLEIIGSSAFRDCYKLENITIPNTVSSLESAVFRNSGLTNIEIPDSITTMGTYIFYECSSLNSAKLSNSLTTIPNYTFRYCSSLKSITIPESVSSIGSYAFGSCTNLENVIYSGTTTQWAEITRETGWASGIAATVVHCSDGDVSL